MFFTAEDIRQYVYCKRVIYFRYVLRAKLQPTVKMKVGKERHEDFEKRRKGENGYFSLYLSSEKLGLTGIVDYFLFEGGEVVPVEVKFGRWKRLYSGHYLQIVAHALLLENFFGVRVKRGIIEYPDGGAKLIVKITDGAKLKVLKILTEIRKIVLEEEIPSPSPDTKKCRDCEAYKICRKI
ncbi:MAG: CRISPR-associated protein Cas4 [Thermosphaera sp.]